MVSCNKISKCIIIGLTYDDKIAFVNEKKGEIRLPCLNIYGEVDQKTLSDAYTKKTSYTTNRQFMLLGKIKVAQEHYYVYGIIDAFLEQKNCMAISDVTKMLDEGKIGDEKTQVALTLLKKCIFEKKNFNKLISAKDIVAKKLLSNKQSEHLTDEDKDYIKKYYLGRQQFMAFYSDFNLSRFMSGLLQAQHGTLLEPSCGSGRLLEYLDRKNIKITCYEIDPQSAKVCSILYPEANVICGDALEYLKQVEGKFDYSMCSPPWGLYVGKLENYKLTSKLGGEDSTFYFTELMIRSLKHGGKGIILLPTSIFQMEQYNNFCELLGEWGEILLRVDLPSECCSASNIIIDSTILLFVRKFYNVDNRATEFAHIKVYHEEWNEFISGESKKLVNKVLSYLHVTFHTHAS